MKILAIAAMSENRVIGKDGKIPWHIPEDMKKFAALTTGHTVLMGRKTYESLPRKYRPLPNRVNVVVSLNKTFSRTLGPAEQDVQVVDSPLTFIESWKRSAKETDTLWVIGGEAVYNATLPYWDELRLTVVKGQYQGDAFFPEFEKKFRLLEDQGHGTFSFQVYVRKSPQVTRP